MMPRKRVVLVGVSVDVGSRVRAYSKDTAKQQWMLARGTYLLSQLGHQILCEEGWEKICRRPNSAFLAEK